jgi:6-phosphofructokinase 1
VVASEGTRDAKGNFLSAAGSKDAFGHSQLGGVAPYLANLIAEAHGYKYHWAVADYIQRSARHVGSAVDVEQAEATGRKAVQLAAAGESGIMPVICRDSDEPYRWHIESADVNEVANREKKIPLDWISDDGYGINEKAHAYLLPLIQGEDYPPYENGLPLYARLKLAQLPRKLPAFQT